MCNSCWDGMGRPVYYDEYVARGAELIRQLYKLEPTGGPLHVELDDWNIESYTITPTYEAPGYPDRFSPEVHAICDELAALLNDMGDGMRGSTLAHGEGWVVEGVVVDAFRQSARANHDQDASPTPS